MPLSINVVIQKMKKVWVYYKTYGFNQTVATALRRMHLTGLLPFAKLLSNAFLLPISNKGTAILRIIKNSVSRLLRVLKSVFSRSTRAIKNVFNHSLHIFSVFLSLACVVLVCSYANLIRIFCKPKRINNASKINILHVTCSFDLGGTQRQIINLCENNKNELFCHETIEIFPELNYLYRKNISVDESRYVKPSLLSKRFGKRVLDPSSRSPHIVQLYKLICDFEAIQPDILVGWGHEIAMLTFVAGAIVKVPKIIFCIRTVNPSYGWTRIGPLLKKTHAKMAPLVDGIIVNSTFLRDDYSKWLGFPKDNILTCPNGAKLSTLTQDERLCRRREIRNYHGIPHDSVVIINIGRFSKEKGQMLLMKAYKKVTERHPHPDIYCLLCGDGATEREVRDYIVSNSLEKVIMCSRVQNTEAYLCASDIFVMPSDFEGMPNAMMEAMALGLPCVSTNQSGIVDIARDNMEALYVEPGSVEQMADKLSYLIGNDNECKRLGSNAKERLKEFSIDIMIARFNRCIEESVRIRRPKNG